MCVLGGSLGPGAGGGLEDDTEEASKAERAEAACDMQLQ